MKIIYSLFVSLLLIISPVFSKGTSASKEQTQQWVNAQPVLFEENKGQFTDDKGNPVPFVLFKVASQDMDVYITEKGLTYVFLKMEENNKDGKENKIPLDHFAEEGKKKIEYCRVDMTLEGAEIKKENIVMEYPQITDFNYYLGHCPDGILNVKRYGKITIKSVYPNIDWVWYTQENKGLKYDFIVHPGASPEDIEMLYEWADITPLNDNKKLLIHTPIGDLIEGEVLSYNGSKEVETHYKVKGKKVSFELSNYDHSQILTIDPPLALLWGTYYGGLGAEGDRNTTVTTDAAGNVFVSGTTNSLNFPTLNPPGPYFQGYAGGTFDAFFLKFTNAGVLLWATYYGGSTGYDDVIYITTDPFGNVFATGQTTSVNFPILNPPGTYFQPANGISDAFIIKFSNVGVLQWATHYGGSAGEHGFSITTDAVGNVFVVGLTASTDFPILNLPGAYWQPAHAGGPAAAPFDLFILKFSNTGVLQWATYYGGSGEDGNNSIPGGAITTDAAGNVFVAGVTASPNFPILNLPGAYWQPANAGGWDAFILKFTNAGVLQWGTYYGGSGGAIGFERITSLATDAAGNVFATGVTDAINNFPILNLPGAYWQPANAGGFDAFVLKFSNAGIHRWATYYGGMGNDQGFSITIDGNNNLFVCGATDSPNFPTLNLPGAYFQGVNSGSSDVFILQFSNLGVLVWATYNGTAQYDFATSLKTDNTGNLFVVGGWQSNGSNGLLNPGSVYYQGANAGGWDAFIMKFAPAAAALNVTAVSTNILCNGKCTGSATANVNGGMPSYTYSWNTIPVQPTATATGLCAGIYTITITDAASITSTATVSITQPSAITATTTFAVAACNSNNGSASVSVNGGTPGYIYNWSSGSTTTVATGLAAGNYTVTITDANNCTATASVAVTSPNSPTVTLTSQINVLCNGDSTGNATVNVGGGTPNYTYLWSTNPAQNTATANGLSAGNYIVIVTDANNCTSAQTVIVTEPTAVTASISSVINADCNGQCTGSAATNVNGGTPNYTYLWNTNPVQNTSAANGLCAGSYTVIITDANSCVVTQTVIITEPAILTATTTFTAATCNSNNGSASILVNGGTPGYTYNWLPSVSNNSIAAGLVGGTYTVTVIDANGCTQEKTFIIDESGGMGIAIPNAFSPNQDGENDEFCLQGAGNCIKEIHITIYNRWGEKVYESSNSAFCWDGVHKGKVMNTDVFVYHMRAIMTNNSQVIKQGNISLVR